LGRPLSPARPNAPRRLCRGRGLVFEYPGPQGGLPGHHAQAIAHLFQVRVRAQGGPDPPLLSETIRAARRSQALVENARGDLLYALSVQDGAAFHRHGKCGALADLLAKNNYVYLRQGHSPASKTISISATRRALLKLGVAFKPSRLQTSVIVIADQRPVASKIPIPKR
jgi:hypothetical protein